MKNKIVADGGMRLFLGQKVAAAKSKEKKQAAELAKTQSGEKSPVYARLMEEAAHHEKMAKHRPSIGTLW